VRQSKVLNVIGLGHRIRISLDWESRLERFVLEHFGLSLSTSILAIKKLSICLRPSHENDCGSSEKVQKTGLVKNYQPDVSAFRFKIYTDLIGLLYGGCSRGRERGAQHGRAGGRSRVPYGFLLGVCHVLHDCKLPFPLPLPLNLFLSSDEESQLTPSSDYGVLRCLPHRQFRRLTCVQAKIRCI